MTWCRSLATMVLLGSMMPLARMAAGAPQSPGVAVTYHLDQPALVTIAIDDAQGQRVRNLIACVQRPAGDNTEAWDGLDDAGRPVPAGTYRWRGLRHGPITNHFQGQFYSPGDPPWLTLLPTTWNVRSGTNGGWLSDHGAPACAFAAGDRVFIGAEIAEAGHSVMELDLDGHKKSGFLWLNTSCANALATEGDVLYQAGEKGWMRDSLAVSRYDLNQRQLVPNPPELKAIRKDGAFVKEKSSDFSGIRGMVLTPEAIVLSLADKDRLAFFDRKSAAHVKDLPLPGAGTIIRAPSGDVLGISGKQVVRIDLAAGQHRPLITEQLDEPSGLTVDAQGQLYVTDLAPAEQCIKVFSPDGKFLRRIGTPGGRHEGRFDPAAMSQPKAVVIDSRNQLWVTEHDALCKRISVWSTDGKLIRDFIGTPFYGGGGALDPRIPSRAYYQGLALEWQPWPGRDRVLSLLYRPEQHPDVPLVIGHEKMPQFPMYRGDKLYLTYDTGWALGGIFIGEVREDRLVPRVAFGSLATLRKAWKDYNPEFIGRLPTLKDPNQGVFLWCDANDDGKVQTEEIAIQPEWRFGSMWAYRTYPSLALHATTKDAIVELRPRQSAGDLRYDLADAKLIPQPPVARRNGIGAMARDLEGNFIINCGAGANQGDRSNVLLGMSSSGQVRWTYPNPYPANWHNSARPQIGDIQHTLNVEGVVHVNDTAGDVFQLNGNKGVRYLMTTDGLFVCQLFADMRVARLMQNLTKAERDMRLDEVSLCDECFFGWFGQTPDGKFMQIEGKDSCNIAEVRGLETLTRMSGGEVQLLQPATAPSTQQSIASAVEVGLNGVGFSSADTWLKVRAYPIPLDKPLAHFAIATSADGPEAFWGGSNSKLEVALDVEDDSPFINNGSDVTTLFKTGDAIDLRLATDPRLPVSRTEPGAGDLRFVIAMFKDQPVVVRYRFVVPGTTNPTHFDSPAGKATVDEVTVLPDARVIVTRQDKQYHIRALIPWRDCGLERAPQGEFRGDVGVIFSDPSGSRSVARYYYFDSQSQVVVDLPSETRVCPARWGAIRF